MMAFRTVLNCFSSDGCYFLEDLHNLLETNKLVKNLGIEKTRDNGRRTKHRAASDENSLLLAAYDSFKP